MSLNIKFEEDAAKPTEPAVGLSTDGNALHMRRGLARHRFYNKLTEADRLSFYKLFIDIKDLEINSLNDEYRIWDHIVKVAPVEMVEEAIAYIACVNQDLVKLFIDVEFNGHQGELISLALVDENYRVGTDGDVLDPVTKLYRQACYVELPLPAVVDPWVAANVVPNLSGIKLPLTTAKGIVETFLNQFKSIHVIADWPDDIKYFMDFLITGPGTRLNTPPLTMEVRRDIDSSDSAKPHNALADAVAIRNAYLDLKL